MLNANRPSGRTQVAAPPRLIWILPILLLLAAFLAPASAAESVPVASANAVTNPPIITIRQFLDGALAWGETLRVRVRGTVTHCASDKTFFIQEGDAGVYVFHRPPTAFRVGELVEVTGLPSLGGFSPTLQHCEARLLGPGTLPATRDFTFAEAAAGRCNMRLIRVRGRLAPERLRGGRTLVLNPGGDAHGFTADLESMSDLRPFAGLLPGSLLELTGVCSVRLDNSGHPVTINLFIRSPADVKVLEPPSWWTPNRVLRALGFTLLGTAITLAWVWSLRRQVRRQTAQIRERLEEIRQLNEGLEHRVAERTAELTEANKELEAFSYSVSHDLRAPLRHISGFASLLQQHPAVAADAQLQQPLGKIIHSAGRLGRLIDDLLVFSRMARVPMTPQRVSFDALVADVLRDLQPDIGGRRIEWRLAPLPEVQGDPATLHLVWQNLLGNALKYTRRRGQAVIEVGCQPGGRDWTFYVRDNGAGFDAKYAGQLFGVFQRLHREDEFEGLGIGLANVRRIIQRHGGRTWAEGEVDQGATVYFTLPQ